MTDAFSCLSDEELCALARKGDDNANEQLLLRYKNFVRSRVRPYFLAGADREDVIQEGMIGLYKAIRDFDGTKNVSFMSFADLCVTRQILTAIKTATRVKHMPLNNYVSFSAKAPGDENERTIADTIESESEEDPETIYLRAEYLSGIKKKIDENLSCLEKKVLDLYLEGRSYANIAKCIGKDIKAIDNALQRVKNKLDKKL